MAFQITNAKPSGKQVKWKFETLENIYTSDVERFKRNVQFWMKKLNLAADTQVELLEGAQWLQDHIAEEKNIVDVDHEIVEDATEIPTLNSRLEPNDTTTDSPIIEPSGDESTTQPDLFEDLEGDVNPPKPKSRKKTV